MHLTRIQSRVSNSECILREYRVELVIVSACVRIKNMVRESVSEQLSRFVKGSESVS